jgi:hypothetical protein
MSEPDDNPFLAPQSKDFARDARARGEPGVVATIIGVIAGLIIAVVMFCVTFFFTCLGVLSIDDPIGAFGESLVFAVAGITAAASFAFTVWGIRRISAAIRRR